MATKASSWRVPLAVPISGRGSNLRALAAACAAPDFPAEIRLVVSNRPGAAGLDFARDAGLETVVLNREEFADRPAYDAALGALLHEAVGGTGLVCLAGFMRILTDDFVDAWRGRLLNIHPSLLPLFKGLHPQQQALDAGVAITGCTVHFVTPEMDSGPIIAQSAVPVCPGDDAAALESRILGAEHRLYPWAVRHVATGAVAWGGEGPVIWDPRYLEDLPDPGADAMFGPGMPFSQPKQ